MKTIWLPFLSVLLVSHVNAQSAQSPPINETLPPSPYALPTSEPPATEPVAAENLPKPLRRPVPRPVIKDDSARINAWTVGLAAGEREGAPLQLATDIARVVDNGDNMHVLSIVTRGPTENIEDLLYLKGVDLAIVNSDSLQQFQAKIPDIRQKITYILNLFPSELHIMVRPEIKSLADLRDKKVNFNTQGTAAAYSGPLIFDKLKITDVQRTFIPHQVAIEQMKEGANDMAAVVFVTSKPVDAFLKGKWPQGFHFLSVTMDDYSYYLPAKLSASDYPAFIQPGSDIETVAIPTFLAAFNWPKGSDHYQRLERFVDNLFTRFTTLQGPGYHPKWKDVVLNAEVPGLTRFRPAQEWLDKATAVAQAPSPPTTVTTTMSQGDAKLWQDFLRWRKQHQQQ